MSKKNCHRISSWGNQILKCMFLNSTQRKSASLGGSPGRQSICHRWTCLPLDPVPSLWTKGGSNQMPRQEVVLSSYGKMRFPPKFSVKLITGMCRSQTQRPWGFATTSTSELGIYSSGVSSGCWRPWGPLYATSPFPHFCVTTHRL